MARRAKRPKNKRLRRLTDALHERRFEPKASNRELVSVLMLSFGALGVGAGIYAQWFWNAPEPPAYAPFLLAGGLLLLVVYAFSAPQPLMPMVVGDLGVGFEEASKVTRTSWYELQEVTFAHGALLLKTAGKPIQVSLDDHPVAAPVIVAEAQRRIPDRVALDEDDVGRLGEPAEEAGETLEVEPPQVAGLTCRASGEPLSVEKDVRMCARCGVLYHRKQVPRRCEECGAEL